MSDKREDIASRMTQIGTPECGIFAGVIALVAALFILFIGFWKTLLIAVIVLLGVFIGGVKDKKHFIQNTVNRLFPAKDSKPYRAEDAHINIHKADDESDSQGESKSL